MMKKSFAVFFELVHNDTNKVPDVPKEKKKKGKREKKAERKKSMANWGFKKMSETWGTHQTTTALTQLTGNCEPFKNKRDSQPVGKVS